MRRNGRLRALGVCSPPSGARCALSDPSGFAGFFCWDCTGPRCVRSRAVFCRSPSALRHRYALFISFPRHWPAPCLCQVGYCVVDLVISEISIFSEMSEISPHLFRSRRWLCVCCRFVRQFMLQNAPFLAIVAVDTEENEPSKVRQLDN